MLHFINKPVSLTFVSWYYLSQHFIAPQLRQLVSVSQTECKVGFNMYNVFNPLYYSTLIRDI